MIYIITHISICQYFLSVVFLFILPLTIISIIYCFFVFIQIPNHMFFFVLYMPLKYMAFVSVSDGFYFVLLLLSHHNNGD